METDDVKGRVEEAAGALADDQTLKREGQIDRAAAKIKEILDEAKGKLDEAADKVNVERARARTKEIVDDAKGKVDDAVEALKAKLRSDR